MRDELTFYLCFFAQSYSIRDWLTKEGILNSSDVDAAIAGSVSMKICRDICNRYKHYVITKPSIDADWSIQRRMVLPSINNEWEWTVIAAQHNIALWDLMISCVDFWEALVAAYGLQANMLMQD